MKKWLVVSLLLFGLVARGEEANPSQDPRVQVLRLDDVPQSKQVGRLSVEINRFTRDIRGSCTAVLIAEEYLLTAAHCVFDHLGARPVLGIEFFPRSLGLEQQPVSRVFVREGWIHKGYLAQDHSNTLQFPNGMVGLEQEPSNKDLAILRVRSDASGLGSGKELGFLKPAPLDQLKSEAEPLAIRVLSYPGDKEGLSLWSQDCQLKAAIDFIGEFDCRIFQGASGAGLLAQDPRSGEYRVVGITSSNNSDAAYAVLFSPEVLADIDNIIHGQGRRASQFEPVSFHTEKKVYINIRNHCDKALEALIYSQRLGEQDWSMVRVPVAARSTRALDAIDTQAWYYHIEATDGSRSWGGRDLMFSVGGKSYGFKRREVNLMTPRATPFHGDDFLDLKCF
ncbi:trypsin-like serine peptidase [Shewanella cyperi]|uniref:trypsin-like serine peptidase n=1 Tax=Shewanella cyperi TaxID=2814292 RepID=UPI001A945505|nr:trypsin-like serine protease [Shewanella cyperi]QSX41371.1 trypsin-like peptidase domain-containing protein [Shewanella cyperi]